MLANGDRARKRQLAAIAALLAYAATLVLIVLALADNWLALLLAWIAGVAAIVFAWVAATRTGAWRWLAGAAAVAEIGVGVVLLVANTAVRDVVLVVAVWLVAVLAARYAVEVDPATLRLASPPGSPAPRSERPVLLMNPRSGGGKVMQHDLPAEAERRGIRPVVLQPGDDLEELAREVAGSGADVIGMAGGDGSQALVASIASEHGLPFVCIPAGTRNHLALDLGVDRDDVVGSLDAFSHGYERTIDLAAVNDRVFVNNVSLGVYAQVVQSEEYRDQKLGTAAAMLPELLGPGADAFDFSVDRPGAAPLEQACMVLVSNNRYELARLGGFGSRARLDEGVLGVVAVTVGGAVDVAALAAAETAGAITRFRGWNEWRASSVEVRSSRPIAAGVDGEALEFASPLRFEIRPGALRVRVARHAPGVSPALVADTRRRADPRVLLRLALGRPGAAA